MGYLTHVDCKEVRSSGTDVRVPSCRELKLTVTEGMPCIGEYE